ncbi:MAG: UxaA family hydrolase [Nocardiopsaceae bacterium]|nr:UxaA family hydrolase [Nocardiopsaceae bacterium]
MADSSHADSRPPDFLAHREGDVVAVAVRDLEPGTVEGGYLRGPASVSLRLTDSVPLGHKLALADIAKDQEVIEYGHRVGIATQDIAKGGHVHVHNVRSARWHNSAS